MPKINTPAGQGSGGAGTGAAGQGSGDQGAGAEGDSGSGGGEGAGDGEGGDEGDDEPDEADAAANMPKTQKELDALIKKRLDRQEKSLKSKFTKDLKKVTDQKDLSEIELEKKKAEGLADRITDKNFLLAARDAGATSGQDKLLRLYKADFETDEDGEILNIEDVLADAKKDFPELFGKKRGSANGGAGGGGDDLKDPSKAFNESIKQELGY